LTDAPDEVLARLLTTIFWAGLETYESKRNPIGVAFLGANPFDFIIPESTESTTVPLYQWKIQRFQKPRPFSIGELVKLAVVGTDRRIYSAVSLLPDGSLVISGLAREGFNVDPDPFVKIIASRPGSLSIRRGRDLLLAYERGFVLKGCEDVVFSGGPVRRALEATARAADLDESVVPDYVEAVRSLVHEMSSHGHGGILIVSVDDAPEVPESAPYKMSLDSSVASLLRLARRLGRARANPPRGTSPSEEAFGSLLRNAFLTEAERVTEELGALTATDGALLLNRHLGLVAFGVMLPLGRPTNLTLATDVEGRDCQLLDFGSRGTRHHAGASYAADHPGSVVFVASEDGPVSCMFRDSSRADTLVWQLGPVEAADHLRLPFLQSQLGRNAIKEAEAERG
jgi:hypothetical protein